MKTFYRTPIKDVLVLNEKNEKVVLVEKGKEVLTSAMDKNGKVTVFTWAWANVDIELFDEEKTKIFTR